MKLISVMRVMDDCERIIVWDDNAASIDVPPLFKGTVKKCKTVGYTRNGVVKMIIPEKDHLAIFVDIEYQKQRRNRDE